LRDFPAAAATVYRDPFRLKHDESRTNPAHITAAIGARIDKTLSNHTVAAGRVPLSARTDVLPLRRRGARPVRVVGGRVDDAGGPAPRRAVGHAGPRLCPRGPAARRPLVSALALGPMAGREPSPRPAIPLPLVQWRAVAGQRVEAPRRLAGPVADRLL